MDEENTVTPETNPEPEPRANVDLALNPNMTESETPSPEPEKEPEPEPEPESQSQSQESTESESDTDTDDYGNPKGKEKVYTEAEVNEMFRKRFKNQQEPAQTQTQTQQEPAGFEYDTHSDDSYVQQLEQFFDQYLDKRQQRQQQVQVQQVEQQRQQEFRAKFEQGMTRFDDFEKVVQPMPFDDTMVVATRAMDDPAAFMYAASKHQAKEIERIAKMSDPYSKVVAIGRLEANMRKQKNASKAPAPANKIPQNDGPAVGNRNIDSLIESYGKKRINLRKR